MVQLFDIDSYVQGYRFSDDPNYYDPSTQTFKDLAGYGERAGLTISTGTPTFDLVGEHKALSLDNTFHGYFESPITWQGSIVVVIRAEDAGSGTKIIYPIIFGDAVTASSNGLLSLTRFSGTLTTKWFTPSGALSGNEVITSGSTSVLGAAHSQETRKVYTTLDGVTVNETAAASGTTTGNACHMPSGLNGGRIGDLVNDTADQTDQTADLYIRIFEMHMFQGNIWTEYPTESLSLVEALAEKYNV